jgi:hypothetical protein
MNEDTIITVPLHSVAHSSAGDKDNLFNLSLISYEKAAYQYLEEQITENVVKDLLKFCDATPAKRYDLPLLNAFNFAIDGVLEGGINNSLCLDGHGKGLWFLLHSSTFRLPRKFFNFRQRRGLRL